MTEDEMVDWHYRLDGHEFEQALGVGDGQGSLACCSHGFAKSQFFTSVAKVLEFQLQHQSFQ